MGKEVLNSRWRSSASFKKALSNLRTPVAERLRWLRLRQPLMKSGLVRLRLLPVYLLMYWDWVFLWRGISWCWQSEDYSAVHTWSMWDLSACSTFRGRTVILSSCYHLNILIHTHIQFLQLHTLAQKGKFLRKKAGIFLQIKLSQTHTSLNVAQSTQVGALVSCEFLKRCTGREREVKFKQSRTLTAI